MKLDVFKKHWNEDGDGVGPHGTGTRWGGDSVGRQSHRDTDTEMSDIDMRELVIYLIQNFVLQFSTLVYYA